MSSEIAVRSLENLHQYGLTLGKEKKSDDDRLSQIFLSVRREGAVETLCAKKKSPVVRLAAFFSRLCFGKESRYDFDRTAKALRLLVEKAEADDSEELAYVPEALKVFRDLAKGYSWTVPNRKKFLAEHRFTQLVEKYAKSPSAKARSHIASSEGPAEGIASDLGKIPEKSRITQVVEKYIKNPLAKMRSQIASSQEPADRFQETVSSLPKGEVVLDIDGKQYFAKLTESEDKAVMTIQLSEKKGDIRRPLGSVDMNIGTKTLVSDSSTISAEWPLDLTCTDVIDALVAKISSTTKVYDDLLQRGIDPDTAKRTAGHWANEWWSYVRGSVGIDKNLLDKVFSMIMGRGGRKVWLQPPKHSPDRIKGLKITGRDRTACLALKNLGEGASKKVKAVLFLEPDGTITEELVRYAKCNRENPEGEDDSRQKFLMDIKDQYGVEQKIREAAKGKSEDVRKKAKYISSTILEPSHATPVDSSYLVKERFFSDKAHGSLNDYMPHRQLDGTLRVNENGGTSPFSEDAWKRSLPVALRACRDVLRGLRYLHECGFVHKDVKPDNILMPKGMSSAAEGEVQGKLSDFGLTAKIGNEVRYQGTPAYTAPELWGEADVEDSAVDMFSYGVTLLSVCDPVLGNQLQAINRFRKKGQQTVRTPEDQERVAKEQEEGIREVQKELRSRGGEPWSLIADLISFEPSSRPTSQMAEKRLESVVDNPSSQYWASLTS